MLDDIVVDKSIRADAVFGLFPANSTAEDDIELYTDDDRHGVLNVLHTLRQQNDSSVDYALSDFIAPVDSKVKDYIGGFAVTAGHGVEELVEKFKADNDDYNSLLVKSIADRLAEALAEFLHRSVRTEYWGYSVNDPSNIEDLLKGQYRGIRPAHGYPPLPDHSEKKILFNLLQVEKNIGVTLSENFMMIPGASVSGLYFAHPQAKYFPVGKVNYDQVEDYKTRKGMSLNQVEKWLSQNLAYK